MLDTAAFAEAVLRAQVLRHRWRMRPLDRRIRLDTRLAWRDPARHGGEVPKARVGHVLMLERVCHAAYGGSFLRASQPRVADQVFLKKHRFVIPAEARIQWSCD